MNPPHSLGSQKGAAGVQAGKQVTDGCSREKAAAAMESPIASRKGEAEDTKVRGRNGERRRADQDVINKSTSTDRSKPVSKEKPPRRIYLDSPIASCLCCRDASEERQTQSGESHTSNHVRETEVRNREGTADLRQHEATASSTCMTNGREEDLAEGERRRGKRLHFPIGGFSSGDKMNQSQHRGASRAARALFCHMTSQEGNTNR